MTWICGPSVTCAPCMRNCTWDFICSKSSLQVLGVGSGSWKLETPLDMEIGFVLFCENILFCFLHVFWALQGFYQLDFFLLCFVAKGTTGRHILFFFCIVWFGCSYNLTLCISWGFSYFWLIKSCSTKRIYIQKS